MTNFVEWGKGVYRIVDDRGKQGEEYGSYLVIGEDKIAIIDLPTRSIGKDIISFVKKMGRDPSEIQYIILTHTHPDHWAGIGAMSKIKPQIVVHESGVEALTQGKKFILEKQFPSPSKFSLAMKSSLFTKISKIKEELITRLKRHISEDILSTILSTEGRGPEDPVVENTDLDNWWRNRRVEIIIQDN